VCELGSFKEQNQYNASIITKRDVLDWLTQLNGGKFCHGYLQVEELWQPAEAQSKNLETLE
jgi:hypothetical protein